MTYAMVRAFGSNAQPLNSQDVLLWLVIRKRPQSGPKKRWKDIIRKDLNDLKIPESCWYMYDLANKSRSAWKDHYHACLETSSPVSSGNVDLQTVVCPECHRGYRRISDLKRHKCIGERVKPIHEQKGAIECQTCTKYFRSKGGYMHYTNASIFRGNLFMTLSLSSLKG